MRKITLLIIAILLITLTISGCRQNEYIKYREEYKEEYFSLCSEIITDTKVVSSDKAYETASRLQSADSKVRLERLKELLERMKEQEGRNEVYIAERESIRREYDMVISIRDSYKKWNELSDEQKRDIAGEYGIVQTFYAMEIEERKSQSK